MKMTPLPSGEYSGGGNQMITSKTNLPRFNRAKNPPGMRFQLRDEKILMAIYDLGGLVAKRQLKELFWPKNSWRVMEKRLSKLYHNGFLDWPNQEQLRSGPVPEPVCWLGWRGALWLGSLLGHQINPPRKINENQMRSIEDNLRRQGFHWIREPRWSLLKHDLAVIDFKIQVENEVSRSPRFSLENWKFETEFRSDPDVISYTTKDRRGIFKQFKKRVLPDAYFEIIDKERQMKGEPHRVRFLLELDRSTHDNPSFGMGKVAPGVAYIKSPVFKSRFGYNSGCWLIVTNGGQRRMKNLMLQTKEAAGQDVGLFFFTSINDIEGGKPLTTPIWRQIGKEKPRALLSL